MHNDPTIVLLRTHAHTDTDSYKNDGITLCHSQALGFSMAVTPYLPLTQLCYAAQLSIQQREALPTAVSSSQALSSMPCFRGSPGQPRSISTAGVQFARRRSVETLGVLKAHDHDDLAAGIV